MESRTRRAVRHEGFGRPVPREGWGGRDLCGAFGAARLPWTRRARPP